MALPHFLTSSIGAWADFYDAHRMVSVTVRYFHLAGLVVGGGTAIAVDRRMLHAARSSAAERAATVEVLHGSHRVVVPALAVVVLSGLLMVASDTGTFLSSPVFWLKMGLVALLVLNGAGIVAAERVVSRGGAKAWTWLGGASAASLLLWLGILFMGLWLTVAA